MILHKTETFKQCREIRIKNDESGVGGAEWGGVHDFSDEDKGGSILIKGISHQTTSSCSFRALGNYAIKNNSTC